MRMIGNKLSAHINHLKSFSITVLPLSISSTVLVYHLGFGIILATRGPQRPGDVQLDIPK